MTRAAFQARYVAALFLGGAVLLVYFAIHAALAKIMPRKIVVILAALDGLIVLDILWNLTVGTFLFMERPREWMLTTRLKRLDLEGAYGVEQIKVMLNALDPGHV